LRGAKRRGNLNDARGLNAALLDCRAALAMTRGFACNDEGLCLQ